MTDFGAFGRVLRTGLSSLRDRAANLRCRLAASRFNPSREVIETDHGNGCFTREAADGSWSATFGPPIKPR